jgi:uncharacterized protein (DUF1810 family)
VGVSLSLAKLEKPPEEEYFVEDEGSRWEEPAFFPEQTQRRRVENIVRSNEEALRKKQHPTITERIAAQRKWAEKQLQEAKIQMQHAAMRRSLEQAVSAANSDNDGDNLEQFEQELNALLRESEEDIFGSKAENEEFHASISRQIMELKERKILGKRKTSHYHQSMTLWQRRRKAMGIWLGLTRGSEGEATFVLPWLLLGSRELACDEKALLKLQITHILNMTHDCPNMFPGEFIYEKITVRDHIDTDIAVHFNHIVDFITRASKCKGRVSVFVIALLHRLIYFYITDLGTLHCWSIAGPHGGDGISLGRETFNSARCLCLSAAYPSNCKTKPSFFISISDVGSATL